LVRGASNENLQFGHPPDEHEARLRRTLVGADERATLTIQRESRMAGATDPAHYKDLVVFLATAAVVVPLFQRFRISPVLGFLAAGVALGPHGLGGLAQEHRWVQAFTISDVEEVRVLAEFGVVFLLFAIGLELSWERLRLLRKLVFGFGTAQVVLCGLAIGGAAVAAGQSVTSAFAIGAALALSSTAVVVPVLSERKRLHAPAGRTAFSALLAQDLAVAPILFTLSVMVAAAVGGNLTERALLTFVPALVGLGGVVLFGRVALRPLLRSVARTNSKELFMAACLLVVIGTGLAAALGGLSMGLGAFIAGLLLAETEFRREVETVIDPFKGLLLGLFFVSVGIGLDVGLLLAEPVLILGMAAGLIVLKTALTYGAARAFGVRRGPALEAAIVLGPAGEFAFVVVTTASGSGLLPPTVAQAVLVSATLTLFSIPVLAILAERLSTRPDGREGDRDAGETPEAIVGESGGPRVLIVGYGRVGKLIGEMLTRHGVAYACVDSDVGLVKAERRRGSKVWWGDATSPDFLQACGIGTVEALVVTMDSPAKVDAVVQAARKLRSDLSVIARARDERHAAALYKLGATDAVPETTEASLQLAENTLVDLGLPMGQIIASIHEKRDEYRTMLQAAAPAGSAQRAVRASVRV
jgi:CPA2 family monovalent cation:H+ antiporter-2